MGVMGMFPLYTLPKSYQKDNFEPCQDFLVLIKNVLMGSLWGAGNKTLLVFFFIFLSLFFFLSGFSFTNIHESQDYSGRGRAFL